MYCAELKQDEIGEMVKDLLFEASVFDGGESRASHREPFAGCVSITIDGDESHAFSRNISPTGVGLITAKNIPLSTNATLGIERLDGTTVDVIAKCRWCEEFGRNWYACGWEFQRVLGIRASS